MVKLFIALIGTIVGSVISWAMTSHRNKLQNTFDLHREFCSGELYKSRIVASKLIENRPTQNLAEFRKTFPEETFHLLQLANFYQRLYIAIKYRQIKTKLVSELFGEVFIWWYLVYFQDKIQLPGGDFHASKNIVSLYKWLRKQERFSQQCREWQNSALQDRQQLIDAAQGTL